MNLAPKSILIIAGHAIWQDEVWQGIERDKFTPEMRESIESHVREGCSLVNTGVYDAITFSGGQTRPNEYANGITNSEAEGMAEFAKSMGWSPNTVIIEPCARDSFENIFYSLFAFNKQFPNMWPERVGVLSMPHKAIRFMLMATGLSIRNFTFHGVGTVVPIEKNCIRELGNMNRVICNNSVADPFLRAPYFAEKRNGRTLPKYENYIAHVKQYYPGYDCYIDQVESCSTNGNWRLIPNKWPW